MVVVYVVMGRICARGTSLNYMKKLRLTHLADDDDTYLLYGQRNFGEIAVDISRCEIMPECKQVPNSSTVPPPALAHERGKKAVTHAVT